jgi:hypothetical protein
METIFKTFLDVKGVTFQADDDFVDRLSRKYTSGLLIILASIVSMRQYFGDSIHCWCNDNCSGNHEKYANMVCWVSNTYYISFNDRLPQKVNSFICFFVCLATLSEIIGDVLRSQHEK